MTIENKLTQDKTKAFVYGISAGFHLTDTIQNYRKRQEAEKLLDMIIHTVVMLYDTYFAIKYYNKK